MARVAVCVDRESWRPLPLRPAVLGAGVGASAAGKCASPPPQVSVSTYATTSAQDEFVKSGVYASAGDGNLVSAAGLRLNSIAFSLDDDEAQKQAKEYTSKLQQEEYKRKRQLDETAVVSSSDESSVVLTDSGSRHGWTHGPEMKFDASELLVTKTVLLSGSSCAAKRAEIREYFHRTFSLYERLFELLSDSSVFYRRPDSLRHPLIFYYGHTAVFFINKLMLGKFISKRIDEKIESTCAIGVDEMSWDDLNDSHYDWPTPEALRNYRNLVRSTVDDVIQSAPLKLPITWDSPLWVVLMGIEHERIHLETSMVLIRQLPIECVRPHPLWQICPKRRTAVDAVPRNSLVPLPGGQVTLGKDVQSAVLYGWDNEYGSRVGSVAPFSVSQFLVSNAEWLEFMADGAYEREEFWTAEGWKFIQFKNAFRKYPIFWVPVDGSIAPAAKAENFRYRTISEIIEMPWDWPVEVNQLEAKAFTNWKARRTGRNIRLPTEDEYNHLRNIAFPLRQQAKAQAHRPAAAAQSSSTSNSASAFSISSVPPASQNERKHEDAVAALGDQPFWSVAPGNINLEHYASSNPIDEFAFALPVGASSSSAELFDVVGNVWQHTETPIAPFAGFQFHPLYDDFSIPTFDNLHNLLMGGSWISTGNESIRTARYAFRRHFYQFAGIRYVDSNENVVIQEQIPSTETDVDVANMAAAHYSKFATPFSQLPNSYVQLARIIMEAVETERFRFTRNPRKPTLFSPRDLSAMDVALLEGVSHLPPAFERVLDLGCGAGRLSFELAFKGNHPSSTQGRETSEDAAGACAFESVVGIDLSTRFLRVGDSLKRGGKFHYLVKSEGDLDAFHAIDLMDANWCARNDIAWSADAHTRRQVCSRVDFMQSDAHNFDGKHSDFDVIVLSHLLEDMYDPKQLLRLVHTRCKVGGLMVILSDYHWRAEKTAKSNWLGGKKESTGESMNTLNALDSSLQPHFIRISTPLTLQQIRRCTDRVFTLHQSELTIWRRFK